MATSICYWDRIQLTGKAQVLAFANLLSLLLGSLANSCKKSDFETQACIQALLFGGVGLSGECGRGGKEQKRAKQHREMSGDAKRARFRCLNRCRFMSPGVSRPICVRSGLAEDGGLGLWLLRSWPEGPWSQGVSHSLGFPSFPFPLQNFKNK